jgi:hypothetical protein
MKCVKDAYVAPTCNVKFDNKVDKKDSLGNYMPYGIKSLCDETFVVFMDWDPFVKL